MQAPLNQVDTVVVGSEVSVSGVSETGVDRHVSSFCVERGVAHASGVPRLPVSSTVLNRQVVKLYMPEELMAHGADLNRQVVSGSVSEVGQCELGRVPGVSGSGEDRVELEYILSRKLRGIIETSEPDSSGTNVSIVTNEINKCVNEACGAYDSAAHGGQSDYASSTGGVLDESSSRLNDIVDPLCDKMVSEHDVESRMYVDLAELRKRVECGWCGLLDPEPSRVENEKLLCTLRVQDTSEAVHVEKCIDIFWECLRGACVCEFEIDGVPSQLKPCRIFSEACCRGEIDVDWEFILKGVCFGFHVINTVCDSKYFKENYSSITAGVVGVDMSRKLQQEIDQGMLSVVTEPCVCVHAMGAVPKDHDGFRAIVDCSSPEGKCVNEFTSSCKETFSYNSVFTVVSMLQQGDYTCTLDVSNAYRAINIHPMSRERQGLSWDFGLGKVNLRDNRLCMGLSSSPYVFTKLSDFVVRCMAREGFSECVNYLDDFCIIARSRQGCIAGQLALLSVLRRLGFFVSFKKLSAPSCVTRFLGIDVDSNEMELRLPDDKVVKLKMTLDKFLRKRKATKRELEQLGGILAHCCKVVHGGRTFSRRVYNLIALARRPGHRVRLNREFRLDLWWWVEFVSIFNGKAKIIPPGGPVLSVYSDASFFGFGALHGADWIAGCFGEDVVGLSGWLGHHFVDAGDPGCSVENINVLEMWPILQGARRWSSGWRDRSVVVVTDNTQVMCAINTGRSVNKVIMRWLRELFWLSITNNFELGAVYIRTDDNVICDSLSRLDKIKCIARIRDSDPMGYMCCCNVFYC